MKRAGWCWLALGVGLALLVLIWTIATQPTPFLPVLEVMAWCGVIRWGTQQRRAQHLHPSPVSSLLALVVFAAVVAVLQLVRPTSLAYGLPLMVGLLLALLALPVRQLQRAAQPLILLATPLLPLLMRWVLPEPLLSAATAAVAAVLLQVLGFDALAAGQHLLLGEGGVRVAGACGGTEDMAFMTAVALLVAITQPPFSAVRLWVLLVLGPALGFVINAIRVAVLAVVFERGGWWKAVAFPSLHDGQAALVFSFAAVGALLWLDALGRPRWRSEA